MFTTNQLINIFSKTDKNSEALLDMSFIVNVAKYVKIGMGISNSRMGYLSRINLLELSKSGIPDDMVFAMVDNGWKLSRDKKYVEIYY